VFSEVIDWILSRRASLGADLRTLDNYISGFITQNGELKRISSLMIGKGKRIRSILYFTLWNNTYRISEELKFKTIAILEIMHYASILHDDVIDGSKMRRGEASFVSSHGAQASILLGDFMLIRAVVEFVRLHSQGDIVQRLFFRECSSTAYGALLEQGLHAGSSLSQYVRCAALKTGAFFKLSCFLGSYLSTGDFVYSRKMAIIGLCVGIIFQVQNDIDCYSHERFEDSEDYLMGRITFPIVILRDYFGFDMQKLLDRRQGSYDDIRSAISSEEFRNAARLAMRRYLNVAEKLIRIDEAGFSNQSHQTKPTRW
jgi:geranylgeranyl pyrophosphate synthase